MYVKFLGATCWLARNHGPLPTNLKSPKGKAIKMHRPPTKTHKIPQEAYNAAKPIVPWRTDIHHRVKL
jgi:hypothetical protein